MYANEYLAFMIFKLLLLRMPFASQADFSLRYRCVRNDNQRLKHYALASKMVMTLWATPLAEAGFCPVTSLPSVIV